MHDLTPISNRMFRITLAVFAGVSGAGCGSSAPPAATAGEWVGTITTEGNVTTVANESGSVWGGTGADGRYLGAVEIPPGWGNSFFFGNYIRDDLVLKVVSDEAGTISTGQPPQQARFEASVSRVRVNVIVTDSEGRFVDDLRAEDFRVYEDGELREVIGVQLVDLVAGEVTSLHNIPVTDATRPTTEAPILNIVAPGPRPGGPGDTVTDTDLVAARFGAIVFFIDFIGLDHITKLHFTNQWEKYLRDRETTAVPQAVYLVDQVGVLREIAPLTTDMEVIRAAQETVEATPLTSAYSVAAGESGARQGAFMEYDRAIYSYRLLTQFAEALAARPGRTALVWVSRGLDLKAGLHARGFGPNLRLLQMQDELVEEANSSNVSIYGVDPSRLIDLMGGDPSGTRAGVRDELGNTLRFAAAETGGEHFIAWADFGRVVNTIENDSDRYYLLTYPGPDPGGDGEYHEIRVEVDRPDVEVRSKQGYVDHPAEERRSRFVSAALTLPGTVTDLPISTEVSLGDVGRRRTDVEVTVTVAGRPLGIQTDEDGALMQRIEVHGVLLDEDKEIVFEMHRQVTEHLDEDSTDPVEELVSRQEWEIEPGVYELRVMVIDDASGRVGTAMVEVEVQGR